MAPRVEYKLRRRIRGSKRSYDALLQQLPGLRPEQHQPLCRAIGRFLRSDLALPLLRNGSDESMSMLVFHFLTDRGEDFWEFDHESGGEDHYYNEYVLMRLSIANSS